MKSNVTVLPTTLSAAKSLLMFTPFSAHSIRGATPFSYYCRTYLFRTVNRWACMAKLSPTLQIVIPILLRRSGSGMYKSMHFTPYFRAVYIFISVNASSFPTNSSQLGPISLTERPVLPILQYFMSPSSYLQGLSPQFKK